MAGDGNWGTPVSNVILKNSGAIHQAIAVGVVNANGLDTITQVLLTQSANSVFAGPTSGGAATPNFRALVFADMPDFTQYTTAASTSSPLAVTSTVASRMSTIYYHYTNLANDLTLSNPTGSWSDGQVIVFIINSTVARVITPGGNYLSGSVTPVYTLVANKDNTYEYMYSSTTGKWNCIGYATN